MFLRAHPRAPHHCYGQRRRSTVKTVGRRQTKGCVLMTQSRRRPSGSGHAAATPDSDEEEGESSAITRAAVLASALKIIDRDGVEGLSMRRLGEAVGRDPMVL